MQTLHAILGQIAAALALLAGAVLMAITLATAFNVGALGASRVGLPTDGIAGYDDLVRLLISAAALMMFPYCQVQRGHVAVDILVERFPRRLQRMLEVVSLALMAAAALFLLRYMVPGMLESRSDGTVAAVLGWQEWPFYLPGILAVALWAAIALNQAVLTARGVDPAAEAAEPADG